MREAGAVYLTERLHVVVTAVRSCGMPSGSPPTSPAKRTADLRVKRAGCAGPHARLAGAPRSRPAGWKRTGQPTALRVERELEAVVDTLENGVPAASTRYVRARVALAAIYAHAIARPSAPA